MLILLVYDAAIRQCRLTLHNGQVPPWLAARMAALGKAIVEEIIAGQGKSALLSKLSDPFWFQSLGAVMGMDWHSSGITTSVMGALKRSINPLARSWASASAAVRAATRGTRPRISCALPKPRA